VAVEPLWSLEPDGDAVEGDDAAGAVPWSELGVELELLLPVCAKLMPVAISRMLVK